MILSSMLNMEFVHALNPLYVFPIVAVIFCVFFVYAVGFKSPAQPPSFDGIEVEKKISKKKKSKENNKGKVAQNGKANGNISTKAQGSPVNKKKNTEKSQSFNEHVEKSPVNVKKTNKKPKQVNEKKILVEKKEILNEDFAEDGWVQLVSKKGRKNRKEVKKDESCPVENQKVIAKRMKTTEDQINDINSYEDSSDKGKDVVKISKPENKPSLQEDKENIVKIPVEIKDECLVKSSSMSVTSVEEETEKLTTDKSSSKVKKKKKKNTELVDDSSIANVVEPPAVEIVSKLSLPKDKSSNLQKDKSSNVVETLEITSDTNEENTLKESKASNVVFDELAELYTEPKEQRKKKKVRRDH